jgi:hypothetical protein
MIVGLGLALMVPITSVASASNKCEHDIVITMVREVCFGACPVYSVQIYADGTVIYVGKENVREIGERRFKISAEKLRGLIKEFERIDFFSLRDRYDIDENGMSVTDQPTTTTSICLNGKKKKVVDYCYAPKELVELEDKIDTIAYPGGIETLSTTTPTFSNQPIPKKPQKIRKPMR